MNRWDICLGWYWYAMYGTNSYEEQCEILERLRKLDYSPGIGNECSAAFLEPENVNALVVYADLVKERVTG